MKKILYDNQMFTFQRFGGVTRYFADLIYNLPQNEFVGELPMYFCENHYVTHTYCREYKKLSFPENYRIRRRIYQLVNRIKRFTHYVPADTIFSTQHTTAPTSCRL